MRPTVTSDGSAPIADDLLGLFQHGRSNGSCTLGTIGQDAVDLGPVGDQPSELVGDRGEVLDRDISEGGLEDAKALASELGQHISLGAAGQRRIDPDQIAGLRPCIQRFERIWQRLGIGLGLADPLATVSAPRGDDA